MNNQVPPGMRANNYWDNFRSFSRQNRFTSDNGPPIAAAPAAAAAVVINNGDNCDSRDAAAAVAAADAASRVIAQVTPRQLQTDPRSAGATGLLNKPSFTYSVGFYRMIHNDRIMGVLAP